MDRHRRLFERRVAEGRIRDCHGDLHSANICLEPEGIQIYDCIEFNHRFRYSDIVCDLAFLAMDLDFHGYPVLSRFLLKEYVHRTGDLEANRLMPFYKCYRACVRAKVHALASAEAEIPAGERRKHRSLAKRYFHLAQAYARADRPWKIIVTFGLTGTGKTTLAQALHRETGWKVVSSDVVRKRLAGLKPTTRRAEAFGQGIYTPELSAKTYEAMRLEAAQALHHGRSVILDGSYKRREERAAVLELARDLGAEVYFMECTAPLSLVRERLKKRLMDPKAISDGRWEIFRAQKADFDPTGEWIKKHGVRVRMDQPAEKLAAQLLAKIENRN
jgi:predicted kinase